MTTPTTDEKCPFGEPKCPFGCGSLFQGVYGDDEYARTRWQCGTSRRTGEPGHKPVQADKCKLLISNRRADRLEAALREYVKDHSVRAVSEGCGLRGNCHCTTCRAARKVLS